MLGYIGRRILATIPIGGGGLIAGCAIAAKAMKPDIKVFGVEAARYPSFTAKRAGQPPVCTGQTIAEGIAIKAVGDIPFALGSWRARAFAPSSFWRMRPRSRP
ncbi:pyridoxal-phosphate dependent enzyme [Methylobacterium organophilum]|nr:pyridoxal-phosphate dependent enzyme [Methylobacterium organophilum]